MYSIFNIQKWIEIEKSRAVIVPLQMKYDWSGYNENIFALKWEKWITEENVSHDRVFEWLQSFYVPEPAVEVQYWHNGRWNTIQ